MNMKSKEEMIYVWLSMLRDNNYDSLKRLIKIFKTVENIYESSKNKQFFHKLLVSQNTFISYNLFNSLTSNKFKEKANNFYSNILKLNICIIPINSKNYPKTLLNLYSPPLVIYARGNLSKISLLNDEKIKMHIAEYEDFSTYGKQILKDFLPVMVENNVCIVTNKNNVLEYENLIIVDYFDYENIQECDYEFLHIGIFKNINGAKFEKSIDTIKNEIISGLANSILIIESDFNKDIIHIVEEFLEQGKDVFAVPGNIYNKKSRFTNHIIQEGAICVTSKYNLLEYIKNNK